MKIYGKPIAGAGAGIVLLVAFLACRVAVLGAFYGWVIMLGLGLIHGSISASVPAAGFLPCWGLGVLFALITSGIGGD